MRSHVFTLIYDSVEILPHFCLEIYYNHAHGGTNSQFPGSGGRELHEGRFSRHGALQ